MVVPCSLEKGFVDHEISAALDSTYCFEGPEKLLEIWFWKSEKDLPPGVSQRGLREIPRQAWSEILDLVNCKILSMKPSASVDAYLLSESSLFVFSHKLILKTCGTTTTLACLDRLFEKVREIFFKGAREYSSFDTFKTFYSRRSFMFPDKQEHVHKDWKLETSLLNDYFLNGKSYVVGDFESNDNWYLYTSGQESCFTENDQTFEVLMTQLDLSKASSFVTSRKPGGDVYLDDDGEDHDLGHDLGTQTLKDTGLDSLLEPKFKRAHLPSPSLTDSMEMLDGEGIEFTHDSFSFTPCGFSSNSISKDGYYYTLHVTPESGWSYASFETNFPFSSGQQVIDTLRNILEIFQPGKFSLTFFSDNDTDFGDVLPSLQNSDFLLKKFGYRKKEKILYDLMGDSKLLYLNFQKRNIELK